MTQKYVVNVSLSKEQADLIAELCLSLGISKSEALRLALMAAYAKECNPMQETPHSNKPHKNEALDSESTQLAQDHDPSSQ